MIGKKWSTFNIVSDVLKQHEAPNVDVKNEM